MRVKVTKEFKWAPDGNHVRTARVGDVLEGRGAEVALQLASGEEVRELVKPAADPPKKSSEPGKGR